MKKTTITYRISCLLVLLTLATSAWSQNQNVADEDPNAFLVNVVAVKGSVKAMQSDEKDAKWVQLKVNDKLDVYSIIKTGFRSSAELDFSDRGKVLIKSGTKIGISQYASLNSNQGTIKASMNLKYGNMRLAVDRSRGKNDFKVISPVATAAVEGTGGSMGFSGDFGFNLIGRVGTFSLMSGPRGIYVGATQQSNDNLERSRDIKDNQRHTNATTPPDSGMRKDEKKMTVQNNTGRNTGPNGAVNTTTTASTSVEYSNSSGSHYHYPL